VDVVVVTAPVESAAPSNPGSQIRPGETEREFLLRNRREMEQKNAEKIAARKKAREERQINEPVVVNIEPVSISVPSAEGDEGKKNITVKSSKAGGDWEDKQKRKEKREKHRAKKKRTEGAAAGEGEKPTTEGKVRRKTD